MFCHSDVCHWQALPWPLSGSAERLLGNAGNSSRQSSLAMATAGARPVPTVAQADPQIEELIQLAKKGDGKLCTTVETILQRCLEQNQAYRAQIQPGHVGIHPRNRDGGGVSWPHCHKLGNDLVTLGFLWEECRHAVCVEDDDKKTIAEFTANFVAASKPHLAQVDARDIRYGSLSCSHTNQFLCAAIAGVPCSEPALSEGQRMSRAKVCRDDDEMRTALDKGLKWLVLRAGTVQMYPALPDLIQSARNAPGQLHKPESQIQVMMRMTDMAARNMLPNGLPNWTSIHSQIHKTCPRMLHAELAALQRFMQAWGGGTYSAHLKDLARFWASRVGAGRSVAPATFAALAGLPLDAGELCPRTIVAIVKAQAVCPVELAPGGVGKMITPADISALAEKRAAERISAERMLSECRSVISAEATALSPTVQHQLLCDLDISVGRAVVGKGMADKPTVEARLFTHLLSFVCVQLRRPVREASTWL